MSNQQEQGVAPLMANGAASAALQAENGAPEEAQDAAMPLARGPAPAGDTIPFICLRHVQMSLHGGRPGKNGAKAECCPARSKRYFLWTMASYAQSGQHRSCLGIAVT